MPLHHPDPCILLQCPARLQFVAELKAPAATPNTAGGPTADPVDSVRNLNRIFAVMDDLEDILQEVLQGWQPPRVVIIGNQSEGTLPSRLASHARVRRQRRLANKK